MIPTRPAGPADLDARLRGPLELAGAVPPRPRLAVVGSRAALRALACAVDPVVDAAAEQGHAIVSGGALGIDARVHRAALERRRPQLAVLPCGPDRIYPADHEALVREIAAAPDSGVVFAQPHGKPPSRAMFVSRNAVVVALVDAVLVVQADVRSGSATTGTLALRRGVPTAAIVGSSGCADLIAHGATPLAWDDAAPDALVRAVAAWLRGEPECVAWPASLERLRAAIVGAGASGATLDELGGPAMATMLWQAEALGLVGETTPGRWIAARR